MRRGSLTKILGIAGLVAMGVWFLGEPATAQKSGTSSGVMSKIEPESSPAHETVRKGGDGNEAAPEGEAVPPGDLDPETGNKARHEEVRKSGPENSAPAGNDPSLKPDPGGPGSEKDGPKDDGGGKPGRDSPDDSPPDLKLDDKSGTSINA